MWNIKNDKKIKLVFLLLVCNMSKNCYPSSSCFAHHLCSNDSLKTIIFAFFICRTPQQLCLSTLWRSSYISTIPQNNVLPSLSCTCITTGSICSSLSSSSYSFSSLSAVTAFVSGFIIAVFWESMLLTEELYICRRFDGQSEVLILENWDG